MFLFTELLLTEFEIMFITRSDGFLNLSNFLKSNNSLSNSTFI